LGALAKRAALSPLHFHRIFKGLAGETPLALHRRLRLERAAWRLFDSDEQVTRLAFDAGYETHESFTRAFREAYAASPSEFRERTRALHQPWAAETALSLAASCGIHFVNQSVTPCKLNYERYSQMNVEIAHQGEQRVLAVSHRGPYTTISDAFTRLDGFFREGKLPPPAVQGLVALYHDDPDSTPAAELRSDAGVIVSSEAPIPDGLHEVIIPAGKYACTMHVGPYTRNGDTWTRFLGGWLVESGQRVGSGPMYERYLNTPMDTAPEALLTKLYLSLQE
jgi:AraC family transcriptional regulator